MRSIRIRWAYCSRFLMSLASWRVGETKEGGEESELSRYLPSSLSASTCPLQADLLPLTSVDVSVCTIVPSSSSQSSCSGVRGCSSSSKSKQLQRRLLGDFEIESRRRPVSLTTDSFPPLASKSSQRSKIIKIIAPLSPLLPRS